MKVFWNRWKSAPAGTGTIVKVFLRDDVEFAEITVNIQASDPEWTTFNIPTIVLPVKFCTPVKS